MHSAPSSLDVAPDTADLRLQPLRRMQLVALGLLGLALAGLITATAWGGQGPWGWVKAFCEAAAVGALADWFAVVALFRRPLGLPIPHTAIIPANKDRIADNLAVFVRDHFLDPKTLLDKLAVFDPAARLSQWLADPLRVQGWVHAARQWGLQALDWLDDRRLQQDLKGIVQDALQRWDAAQTAGQVLTVLTHDGRHQDLLDGTLDKIGEFLNQDEVKQRVSALLVKHARKEWPTIIALVNTVKSVDSVAGSLADKLASALMAELQDILRQPDHPVRVAYGEKVEDFIARLRTDPALAARVQEIKAQLIDNPAVHTYVDGLAQEAKDWLRRDLADPNSRLGLHLQAALSSIGSKLASDASLREAINSHILSAAALLVQDLRGGVTEHIASTVKGWDDRALVREMERSVGKDLQFIRINGTLVGGLMGVVLYAGAQFLPILLAHLH
ncbi:MAG: DUF445 family protein [Burkholderiales bacterium]|nr:DUF445 family protein [Burkholderiales bacterium]